MPQRMSMNGFFEQMEQEEITQVAKDHYLSTNFQVPAITTSLNPGTLTELYLFLNVKSQKNQGSDIQKCCW